MQSQFITVVIQQPFDEVYGFLADPMNFPSWGAVSTVEIHHLQGSDWLIDALDGPRVIRFTEPNLYGVLDYSMFGAGEQPGAPIPVRLVPGHAGSELTITWRQRAGISDDRYVAEVAAIEDYLGRLKAMLEADPAG